MQGKKSSDAASPDVANPADSDVKVELAALKALQAQQAEELAATKAELAAAKKDIATLMSHMRI